MLRKIDRILLRVPSLESALAYYRDTLGLKAIKHDARLATLRLSDCDTELVLHNDPDLPAEAIYYLVDDVRALYANRAKLRLTFISPPSPVSRGHRATARDPFGNVLLLLDRTALRKILGRDIGKRDRLPYTKRFDELVDAFNKTQGRPLSPHLVWRLVATLAK